MRSGVTHHHQRRMSSLQSPVSSYLSTLIWGGISYLSTLIWWRISNLSTLILGWINKWNIKNWLFSNFYSQFLRIDCIPKLETYTQHSLIYNETFVWLIFLKYLFVTVWQCVTFRDTIPLLLLSHRVYTVQNQFRGRFY